MNRRQSIRIFTGSSLAVAFGACEKPEDTKEVIQASAIIGVLVGDQLRRLPIPAMRITGVALIFAGEATKLVIDYLDFAESAHTHPISVALELAQDIQNLGKVIFRRKDGKTEERRLDKEQYKRTPKMPQRRTKRCSELLRASR